MTIRNKKHVGSVTWQNCIFPLQYFITETHRFPTVVQLIHHHSQAADGLICPLLYPAARREQPSSLRSGVGGNGTTSAVLEACSSGAGAGVGLDDWEIDRSEFMMRNKLGK